MSLKSAEDEDVLMRIFQDIPRYPNFHLNHIQNYRARMTRMSSETFFSPKPMGSSTHRKPPELPQSGLQRGPKIFPVEVTCESLQLDMAKDRLVWDHIFHIYATLVGFILVIKKAAFDLPNIFKVSKVDPCRHT
jgi:hypothetical protein